ncbi:MAG: hypothetical protein ABI358_08550 [Ginsengibacter sp.]
MNDRDYPFALNMFGSEAKVRGLFITVACDFDVVISHMIMKCEEPDKEKRDALFMRLPYEMGKKLNRCKKALKAYNEGYYNRFLVEFDAMKELLKYRNMLAHGYSQFDEKQLDDSFIIFNWIEKGKLKIDKIALIPFYKNILRFRKHLSNLYELHAAIVQERG